MSTSLESVMDEAIAWHIGLEEAGADDWHRFVAWLEADPAHAEAYDRLTLDDEALPRVPAPASAPSWTEPVRRPVAWRRWGGMGGGIAAAAAAAWLAFTPALHSRSLYSVETAPGAHQSVTLPDGTRVALNGDTKLTLDRNDPRVATLDRGEAMFRVVHHADRPFQVRSGGMVLQDVGTAFNVTRAGPAFRVAVAEGEVLYQPEGRKLSLGKGMALAARDDQDRVELRRVDADSVGGWAQNRLDFRETALATVAEDVSRSTGAHLAVAPGMAARKFTGTLRVDRSPEDVARSLAALAGGTARRDGPGWTIAPIEGGAN